MKFEFSAGGIVFRREGTRNKISSRKNAKNIVVLVCQHSQHHGWVFPKGLIGDKANASENKKPATTETQNMTEAQKFSPSADGSDKFSDSSVARETKEEAALREVREETGVCGKIAKALPPVTYWYKFDNEKIKKTVYYFLMTYVSGDIKDHDFEMEKVEWLPVGEVEKRLTYKSDKEIWKEAKKIIEKTPRMVAG